MCISTETFLSPHMQRLRQLIAIDLSIKTCDCERTIGMRHEQSMMLHDDGDSVGDARRIQLQIIIARNQHAAQLLPIVRAAHYNRRNDTTSWNRSTISADRRAARHPHSTYPCDSDWRRQTDLWRKCDREMVQRSDRMQIVSESRQRDSWDRDCLQSGF